MTKIVFFKGLRSFVLLVALFPVLAYSQSKQEQERLRTEAKTYFEKHQFQKALEVYLLLDSLTPNVGKYSYPIGICYMNQLKNEQALPYLEKCLETPEKYPRNLDYFAAKAYHLSHKFDDALIHYDIYKHKLKHSKKNKIMMKEIDREIASCRYAKELVAKPLNIKIVNLGNVINSKHADYGPVLSADEQVIIFTSARPNTTGGMIDENDGRYFEDIYISNKADSGWSTPTQIGSGINTNGNDASISLSPDGQKLLLYRSSEGALGATVSRDLYISRLKGNTWTEATPLPEQINTKAWEPSACLSADERILYFSSDREGGSGGTDLYMVRKLPHGEWALPMNLGNKINTPFDDDSPFIHPDGKTLYFSSTGHRTMGGFDIFVSKYNEETKEWSAPENVGYPLNTAHDDIHFSWSADGRRVYFSSVRPEGFGENDIYYADIDKEAANVMVLKGQVLDSLTGQPIEATIKVFDTKTNELLGVYNSNSITGKYIIIFSDGRDYNMTIEAESYKLDYENINVSNVVGFEEEIKNIRLLHDK